MSLDSVPDLRPIDREILRLAVPALGALAAEPLYILVDTAVVGHLGTPQLGGLAVAGTILTTAFFVFNFLAYGTTAAVARLVGAKDERTAAHQAVQGVWLALGIGIGLLALGVVLAPAAVGLFGSTPAVRANAEVYLRVSALGAPAVLLALVGVGYLRGLQDTKRTLAVAVGSNVVNLVLELVLIYGLGMGIAASAAATVVAQYVAAGAYVAVVLRERAARRGRAATGRATVAGARRRGPRPVRPDGFAAGGAGGGDGGGQPSRCHRARRPPDRLPALELPRPRARRHRHRRPGDDRQPARGRRRRRRPSGGLADGAVGDRCRRACSAVAVLALRAVLVPLFTDDPAVTSLAYDVLLVVAVLQPVNAVVFVLDGVLIGAGDLRYLAKAMAVSGLVVFLPAALVVRWLEGSLLWLWAALALLMSARLVGNALRFAGTGWQVVGSER